MPSSERFGIAVDLGTTTIGASIVDLRDGTRCATATALNPQGQVGVDVITRMAAACEDEGSLLDLKQSVNVELNRLATELLEQSGVARGTVARVAIAGNPAMEHFLLGLPVRSLAFPPYRPLFRDGQQVTTADLGWDLAAQAFIFPLPGGFVGGDLLAFLYSQGVTGPRPHVPVPSLFLDLGTNGEIALLTKQGIQATSVAAGPALEGGNLTCGMAALPGAISDVTLALGRISLTTMGGKPPMGICGSGVIAAVARLLEAGLVDTTGRILPPAEIPSNLANKVVERGGQPVFLLYRDASRELFLSQQDIRQVQLAKGAIRAGIEVLMDRAGIPHKALQNVVLTGSFGTSLHAADLKSIGIFTENMVQTARFVHDGALTGVERSISQPSGFLDVDELARTIKIVPLSGTPAFTQRFLEQMDFPGQESLGRCEDS